VLSRLVGSNPILSASDPRAGPTFTMNVIGIGHVAIRVKDVERTLEFYVGRLGFEELFRLDRDGRLWLLYLHITDSQFLEVFPEAAGDRAPPREANGLNHICLEVADIDAAIKELSAAGVRLTREKQLGADGNYQAWIEDPDGNRIELMQMSTRGMQRDALKRLKRRN
jgi:lactoylglutathione lyase